MGSTPSKPQPGFPSLVVDPGSRILWWKYGGDISICTGSYQALDVTIMCYTDAKLASDEYHLLHKLDHTSILKPSFLLLDGQYYSTLKEEWSYMRIPNHVVTWQKWLELKKKEFKDEQDLPKSSWSWWQFIKSDFKKIFKDYIRAFWYIYDTKIATLDSLTTALFVEYKDGVLKGGLMKPQKQYGLESENNSNKHLKEFREIMMRVIGGDYIFNVEDVCEDKSFGLEKSLVSYLKYVLPFREKNDGKKIHPKFILDSPFFWDDEEKANFSKNFVSLLGLDVNSGHTLDTPFASLDGWSQNVPCQTIFRAILRYHHNDTRSKIAKECGKIVKDEGKYDNQKGSRAHVFINNCFKHYNDTKYECYHGNWTLTDTQIVQIIEGFLPDVYWRTIELFLDAAKNTNNYYYCRDAVDALMANKKK